MLSYGILAGLAATAGAHVIARAERTIGMGPRLVSRVDAGPGAPYAFDDIGILGRVPTGHGLNDDAMPAVEHHFWENTWAWGTVPFWCAHEARAHKLNVSLFDVHNFKTADCDLGYWHICHNSTLTAFKAGFMHRIAAIPVLARQNVRHYVQLDGGDNGGIPAYAPGNMVVSYANLNDASTTFIHETTHVLDWTLSQQGLGGSGAPAYKASIQSDTCLISNYGRSGDGEEFAELAVAVAWDANVQSFLPFWPNANCASNQFANVKAQIGKMWKYNATQKCTQPPPVDNQVVCMSAAARAQGRCNGVPNYEDVCGSYAGYCN